MELKAKPEEKSFYRTAHYPNTLKMKKREFVYPHSIQKRNVQQL